MSRKTVLSDEQSKINARLEAHMVYVCPECGKAFGTQVEWRQHLNAKHDYLKKTYVDFNFVQINDNSHECQLCFKWVENAHKTIALLQYHYFTHLEHCETYRCVHCQLAYTRRRALNEHLMTTHMQQIEKYEAKLKQVKRLQDDKKVSQTKSTRQQGMRKDLLQKALMDIDLQLEDPAADDATAAASSSKAKANPQTNPNASELALDRCLNAYEDFVRKEEAEDEDQDKEKDKSQTQNGKHKVELEALCQDFFENHLENNKKVKTPTNARPQQNKEVVTIEIDAVGEEEMVKLKNDMKSDSESEPETTLPHKRKRLSDTALQDSDFELSIDGLNRLISYLCPKCGKEFAAEEDWRRHVFKRHDFENLIEHSFQFKNGHSLCLQCREIQNTTKRSELQKHCFKHLKYRSYLKCNLCERTKTKKSKMYHHIRYNHQEELQRKNKTQLLIKPEPKWTPRLNNAVKKIENPTPDRPNNDQDQDEERICEFCHKSFKTTWRFERHALLCRAPGAKIVSAIKNQTTVDELLQHLREAQIRMNEISKNMQIEAR